MKLKTYNLLCRFCQKQCGTYDYPSELSVSDLHIADVRCEQHEQEFGNFNKMAEEFTSLGKTYNEFLSVMAKSDYKKSKLDTEIQSIKEAITEPILGSIKGKKKLKK